ncbi:hypothetical protein [Actomonas aquatica]|uniref:CopG family transcriptional regulator n=1 Tax=Actomonas aquatica TaxID=2866162 RepID=A0ABZ1C5E2_9BACT|nr:hypothetical protein [Opitutus sp. WL0086]WRQ86736.1 hypothetical protein K1X11_018135 [Opitutus sp. WL0086]
MKTTFNLPDELLTASKTAAAQRGTTLVAFVESALRRELRSSCDTVNPDPNRFERNELGFLVIKSRPTDQPMTSESIRALQEVHGQEEFARATGDPAQ